MPQLLTPEQIDELKRIIAKHHAMVILKLVGPSALTPSELRLLEEVGSMAPEIKSMEDSYAYGQLLSKLDQKALELGYEGLKQELAKNPLPLSQPEQFAIENANQHAGAHIRHLGAKVEQQASMVVFREDAAMRAKLLTEEVIPATKSNIEKRQGIQKLKSELGKRVGDWSRDWNRVAVTEKVNAMNAGMADSFHKNHGDPWVFKRTMPGACKHCLRLHIGPDGHPRIFKLSTLQANGTNAGKKAQDWAAVVGSTHPHCQCQLVRVPDGWGFDEDGTLVPDGEFGIKYNSEGDIVKAVAMEDALQKAFKVKERVNVGGLPISIEQRIGDLRHWKDQNGNEGATRMIFAYGYIDGSLGPDGDEYDCYVGPDPLAPFVYVVHQVDPETGEWDEDKAMIGFPNEHTAKLAYLAHYDSEKFFGAMSIIPIEEFREKIGFTRRPGSMQSDGMLKSNQRRSAGGLRAEDAAQHSVMGQRGVTEYAGGVNLVLGMKTPLEHIQAKMTPRVQVTPAELTRADEREKEAKDGKGIHLAGHGLEKRGKLTLEAIEELSDRPHLVYTFDEKNIGTRSNLGEEALKEIPKNRHFLEREIVRRLDRVSPNYSSPEKVRPKFVLDSRSVKGQPMLQKAGPFIGPRGGKWADPKHTIPWKEGKKKIVKRPLKYDADKPKRQWKEGYPPGIQKPNFDSWVTGQRGGTEEKHWDKEAQNFKPERLALHKSIKTKFVGDSKPVPKSKKPIALITMGGPASGKTTMIDFMHSTSTFSPDGFVRVDADAIKEELPEYKEMVDGSWRMAAAAVHHESTTVMRGLKQEALDQRKNMVIDTTGADLDILLKDIADLKQKGYEVRVMMPHLDVETGLERAHTRAEEKGRFVPDGVVKSIYTKVPKNVAKIAEASDQFDLLDNRGANPELVYQKRTDTETNTSAHHVWDEKLTKQFPGLFDMAAAVQPGLSKAEGSQASKPEVDGAIKALLERMKKEAAKPREKKFDPKAGDYTLDLPLVDGLEGQILEGSKP